MISNLGRAVAGAIAGVTFAAFAAGTSFAQQFPNRSITVIVPNAPGGPNDLLARVMAAKLEPIFKQSVIVENRPGGGTYTGGAYVARASPDGHTLLVNAYSGMQPHIFVKGIELNLSKELVPVAPLSEVPYMLYGPSTVPAKDLKEFIAYAKANPKKLNVAVYPGTANSLEMLSFLKRAGVELVPISYSSTATILTAMLQNDVHIYNGGIGGPKAQMDAGKVKGFAVTAANRDPAVPNVPSTKELGYDWESSVYYVVFAPAKTPMPVVNLLNERINAVMHEKDVVDRLAGAGSPVAPAATAQQMAARLAREVDALEKAAKEAGVVPQ
jgi:tripartite-type tricarboxylate transporter receptor subunit TctC